MEDRKPVILVSPSVEVAKKLQRILEDSGEFRVEGILPDLSGLTEDRPRGLNPDLVLIDAGETGQPDPSSSEGGELSAREKEILVCVAKGMLNKEIADKLNLSIYTVITHRKNITRKIGIKTVAGLTVYALLNNLIDLNTVQ